ncbi:hypothetical protein VTL71DRAFT_5010 [Oculimacula yallundae]|uniref:Uncharacterized protein n=1 Tax=Oculimacula yallundae TaxID=86028 RepID=A0ABR4BZW5_9HELO
MLLRSSTAFSIDIASSARTFELRQRLRHVVVHACLSLGTTKIASILLLHMIMIETTRSDIPKELVQAAYTSLDKSVERKKEDAGTRPRSHIKLEWTTETKAIVQALETSLDINLPLRNLGLDPTSRNIKWAGPIIYGDTLPEPLKFSSSALGDIIIGIFALGVLHLPKIGESSLTKLEAGHIAYFKGSSPVVYRHSEGRAILFYIS